MSKSIFRRAFIAAVLPMVLAGSVAANQTATVSIDVGASERVNYSGKLRMLSQRVVATGCNYVAGVDPDASGAAMEAAMEEFGAIVNALEFGDPDLGIIGAEGRLKTRVRIAMLRERWLPVILRLSTLEDDPDHAIRVAMVAQDSGPLLDMAKLLVSDLTSQYADPNEMILAFGIMIDIAGRQRMLTQRMSKNICLINSDLTSEQARGELAATAQLFDTSLTALRAGMPEAGISQPPTAEIEAGLDVVHGNWMALKPQVERALAGDRMTAGERAEVFHAMNEMTANMNKVVGLYATASTFQY